MLKKKMLTMAVAGLMATMMSMTAFAATAQEVIAKTAGSYTAGTSSVYGAKLNQDQLNAVASVAADFATNYVNNSMDNDAKIRAGYNYIKNNVAYIDWRESTYANTAYGALVEKKAACSGMTRAFVALMDAVDVKAYWIHGSTNDHQWNMVEFNDGFYFIDIDANIASGFEAIYKSSTHPYAYDTAAYPAIGSKSGGNTSGSQTTEGWVQDNVGWWYRNADGSYPVNAWKAINGKWYYFEANGYMAANKWINGTYYVGSDGAMLTNTTTPDGYQVGADGAWIQTQELNDGVHTKRASEDGAIIKFYYDETGLPYYANETRNGVNCTIIDSGVNSFRFLSSSCNINPTNHYVLIFGATSSGYKGELGKEIPFVTLAEPIEYPFEYDKAYSLDFTGQNMSSQELAEFCNANNAFINISVIDRTADSSKTRTGFETNVAYANESSVVTGIGK